MTVVHENVFIFFPFADIQMLHNFAARTMFNNDFTIWRSILIHYTTNKYLLVSTTPPTLSILQFNLPAAINRESSLEDTTLKCPVRIICTLISLNQVKKRLNFRMPNPVHSISCPVAWKFFRLSFRRWFIHLFVCSFWHFPQETTGRFIHINYSQLLELWHSWSINVQITPDYMSLNNIIPEPAHFQPVVIKRETLGEIKNPNQKILVLLNTPLGLSLLAKKIAASGKEIGTWHIKLVSDSKNTPM